MGESAASTIQTVAQAYLDGDVETFEGELDDSFRGHGSDPGEHWASKTQALGARLSAEVAWVGNLATADKAGSLVDNALAAAGVEVEGDIAWFTCEGNLTLDRQFHPEASWTVVLKQTEGDWKVVLSHFSIHRSSTHVLTSQ